MKGRRNTFYERLRGRLDRLDNDSLQKLLSRLMNDKSFFEEIFDTVREGIIVIDNRLRIQVANPAALQLFGLPKEAVGEPIGKYFRQINWTSLLELPPGEWGRFSRRQIQIFYPERRFVSFYLLPAPVRPDGQGEDELLATLIFHDITESCQDNAKTVETQRVAAITKLAAGVAHELGNPLNALGIHLQVLRRKCSAGGEEKMRAAVEHFIGVADQELKLLDGIVKNFLNAVRPDKIELELINLQELVLSALGIMEPELQARSVQVKLDFPSIVPQINGDRTQLTQAFYNLIKNAMEAMKEGGELRISCTVDDVFVNLRFEDTGKGLSREEISHLMEPYYTTRPGGHGLGLLIVDRIVRSHGGDLSIDGKPGEGAAFTISLPRHARMVRQLVSPEAAKKE